VVRVSATCMLLRSTKSCTTSPNKNLNKHGLGEIGVYAADVYFTLVCFKAALQQHYRVHQHFTSITAALP
jgi:hypothetical protein